MEVYAPEWLEGLDSIRVLMTHIGLVASAVRTPKYMFTGVL